MSKAVNPLAFASNFTSDNLKRLKELARLGAEYRAKLGASKSTINADSKLLDKLADIKRIRLERPLDITVSPEILKENA